MRAVIGRLSDVGSRINWVSWLLPVEVKTRLFGKCLEISLRRSGSTFDRVSAVALQDVSKCVMSSGTVL